MRLSNETHLKCKMKKYILTGNNLKLEMHENKNRLRIIGLNNYVKIVRNEGNIEMVGQNCNVDIKENYGKVEIIGHCGSMNIESSSNITVEGDRTTIGPKNSFNLRHGRLYSSKESCEYSDVTTCDIKSDIKSQ